MAEIRQALFVALGNQGFRFSGDLCEFNGSNSRRLNGRLLFSVRCSATGADHQFLDNFMSFATSISRFSSLTKPTETPSRKLLNGASVFFGA
jgi:hypothetical protein